MTETFQLETPRPPQDSRRFSLILFALALALLGSLAIYFWPGAEHAPASRTSQPHLPFGPAEQAYVRQIQIENPSLSRAENFLHQEVTTLSSDLLNSGNRSLADVQMTVEFYDELQQVVLRETRAVFDPRLSPLPPGGRRQFEISFDHVPSSWNMQLPAVKVTGIRFASSKE